MDRLVLESDPHRVLEGLAIAAYAIGAAEGYLYIRAEYPLAVRHVRDGDPPGRGARLPRGGLRLEVREGAGAFVCGEETALIQSLEGKRGMPKLRPPYPVERGFRGQPTLINNVETLASVPWIMRHGAAAFAALGTHEQPGHEGVRAGREDQPRRPDRSSHGHHHSRSGGGYRRRHQQRAAIQSRATRRAVRAAASRRGWPIRRSTTTRWPRPAPSWAPAGWWCSTTAIAWSISPASS